MMSIGSSKHFPLSLSSYNHAELYSQSQYLVGVLWVNPQQGNDSDLPHKVYPMHRQSVLEDHTTASNHFLVLVLQLSQCLLLHLYFISSHDDCSSQTHTQLVLHRQRGKSGSWVDSSHCFVQFHQLQRCHSCLQLYIVELHVLRNQRYNDIHDNPWPIHNNRCCQRLLHLVSSSDIEDIKRLAHFIDQQSRNYSSFCRLEHLPNNEIDPFDYPNLYHQRSLFHSFLPSSIRQCAYSPSQQWQYFDYRHRRLIQEGSRVNWWHYPPHFHQPQSLHFVTIMDSVIEWAYLQRKEMIMPLCRIHLCSLSREREKTFAENNFVDWYDSKNPLITEKSVSLHNQSWYKPLFRQKEPSRVFLPTNWITSVLFSLLINCLGLLATDIF